MRQRLALSRVFLKDATVVLLDEPYGHLDPPGFRLVDRLLESLRAKGRTVLMATHLLARGRALCDQALLLEGGRLNFAGPSGDLKDGDADAPFAEGAL
jgi:ABC-type multidrug transport system ATPase subunit